MRYTLLLAFITFCSLSVSGQLPDTLEVFTPEVEVPSKTSVDLPVKVIGYENIEAVQFSINWNPQQFQFDSISYINPESDIAITDIGLSRVDEGIAVLSFIDPIGGGVSLPDSSTLFELSLTAIGPPSQKNPINISGYDRELDAFGQGKFRTVLARKTRNTITEPNSVGLYSVACSVTKPSVPNGEITFTAYGQAPMNLFFKKVNEQLPSISVMGNGSNISYDSLEAATYDVRLIDASQNEVRDTITLPSQSNWNVDLELTPPTCSNSSDGSAVVNDISGYQAPYVITWSTFDILNPRLDSIGNGGYYLRIQDSLGCVYEELFSFDVPEPIIDLNTIDASCAGIQDGEVQLKIVEGNAFSDSTFIFQLDNQSPVQQKEFSASDLEAGTHTITVIDSTDCTYQYDFEINYQHSLEILDTTTLNIGCDGSMGGFIAEIRDTGSASGNITPTLSPDQGNIQQTDSTVRIENLPEGTYTLHLNIENSPSVCGDSIKFEVTAPSEIDIVVDSLSSEICSGENNGYISLSASGGLGSFYTFEWEDGVTSSERTNLSPGEYCLTVTDDSGCSAESCFTIEAGTDYEFILDSLKELSCPGVEEGYIEFYLNHLSGPESQEYNIEIDPEVEYEIKSDSIVQIDSLLAGAYFITITNENSCAIDTVINVGEPPSPSVSIDSIADAGCFNSPEGYISLSAEIPGDTSTSVKWLWNTGDTSSHISNLNAGTYTVTVTDEIGCSLSRTYNIDSIGGPVVKSFDFTEPKCNGDSNGRILIDSAYSEAGIETVVWLPDDTTDAIENLASGFYRYEVTDSAMCILTDSIELQQPDSLEVDIITQPQSGTELGTATIDIEGGTSPYNITWSTTPPIMGDTSVMLTAGNYTVVVIDSNSCVNITSFNIDDRTSTSLALQSDLKLYPNPAGDKFFITGSEKTNLRKLKIQLINSNGREVNVNSQYAINKLKVDISSINPGIYTLILTYNGLITHKKLVIQR